MKQALMAIGLLLLLAACGVPLNTVTLSPSQVRWAYQPASFTSFWCTAGDEPGTAPAFSAGPNETLAGFSDFYNPGLDPFACVVKEEQQYRGGPIFDLSQFDNITSATLSFNVERSILADKFTFQDQVPPACNATTLGMGTEDVPYNFDNPVQLPPCAGGPYSFDVSTQARDWTSAQPPHGNFGFILAGPRLDFPSDLSNLPNDLLTSVSWYNNFQLTVLYNPALNPRAPQ